MAKDDSSLAMIIIVAIVAVTGVIIMLQSSGFFQDKILNSKISDDNALGLAVSTKPFGSFDVADCNTIGGWARDPDFGKGINVKIYMNQKPLVTVSADKNRSDLCRYTSIGCDHAFSHAFTSSEKAILNNGKSHTLSAYAVGKNSQGKEDGSEVLIGTKNIGICGAPTTSTSNAPQGYLDAATCDSVGGWAKDSDFVNDINVAIYADGTIGKGTLLATIPANANRKDVGNHAFNYVFTSSEKAILNDGKSHTIYAYAIGKNVNGIADENNAELTRSPIKIGPCGTTKTCKDTDGGSYIETQGTCADNSKKITDSCKGQKLTEAYCDTTTNTCASRTYACLYQCGNGACIKPAQTAEFSSSMSNLPKTPSTQSPSSTISSTKIISTQTAATTAKLPKVAESYNCQLTPSIQIIASNIGYSYATQSERVWQTIKTMKEKECKVDAVLFSMNSLNFPLDGVPNEATEEAWVAYWDKQFQRASELDLKIHLSPMPTYFNSNPLEAAYTLPPGISRFIRPTEFNFPSESDRPVMYTCNDDGTETMFSSHFDPNTIKIWERFITGIKNRYEGFNIELINLNTPADFGEVSYPNMDLSAAVWTYGWHTKPCYYIGDEYAPQDLKNPSTFSEAAYRQSLLNYVGKMDDVVKKYFPNAKRQILLGSGSDFDDRGGYEYDEAAKYASDRGIAVHSTHAGIKNMEDIYSKIKIGLDAGKTSLDFFSSEPPATLSENQEIKRVYYDQTLKASALLNYFELNIDHSYLFNLYSTLNPTVERGLQLDTTNADYYALRSTQLTGYIDYDPKALTYASGTSISIGGWAFYNPACPNKKCKILMYAGPIANEGSAKHTVYMQLVAQGETLYSRGDLAGYGAQASNASFTLSWTPKVAAGDYLIRVFIVNPANNMISEIKKSPIVVHITSPVSGYIDSVSKSTLSIIQKDVCAPSKITISGTATDTAKAATITVTIVDEFSGKILGETQTNTDNAFSFSTTINEPGVYKFRAYVKKDTDYIALSSKNQFYTDSVTTLGDCALN